MKYEFIFNNDTTNEVLAHNRLFHLEKMSFGDDYRVDIIDNKGFTHTENTSNQDFRKLVNTSNSLNEQMNEWANYILNHYDICDVCGNLEMILGLHDYDYEEFPQLRNKKVCDKCRTKFYTESLNELEDELENEQNKINNDMKEKGYNYLFAFWIHPNHGDDFRVDIYTNKKLTKAQITKQKKDLKEKYSAELVEEPICSKL